VKVEYSKCYLLSVCKAGTVEAGVVEADVAYGSPILRQARQAKYDNA